MLFLFLVIWFISLSASNKRILRAYLQNRRFYRHAYNLLVLLLFLLKLVLIRLLYLLNRCTWYHYPQQIQDILDHSWQTLMLLEDWNFKIATNLPVPLNQEMIQASCFIACFYPIVIFVIGVFWRDSMHFNRDRTPMVLNTALIRNWIERLVGL